MLTEQQNRRINEIIAYAERNYKLCPITQGKSLVARLHEQFYDGAESSYLIQRAVGRMARIKKESEAFDPTVEYPGRRLIRVGRFDKHRGLLIGENGQKSFWPTKKRSWNSAFLELKQVLRSCKGKFRVVIDIN